ncbi:YgcG family protein [Oxynema sp. CENA135]|uniref:TPM domain-containing protein n=1 Tax=Oxynema sp. CENA135 TaxID=984206 RepID=UPI00351C1D6D
MKCDLSGSVGRIVSKIVVFTAVILLFCFWSVPSHALSIQDVPNPRQLNGTWVSDTAEMLSPTAESQLNQMIDDLERQNGSEIAVVTVLTTKPYPTPKQFTTALFNQWGIGKRGQDNGILFLVSKNDRRVEIETGYGLEGILPDAKVGRIVETQIIPRFKQEDFEGGILAGTQALISILIGEEFARSPRSVPGVVFIFLFLSIAITLWGYLPLLQRTKRPLLVSPEGLTVHSWPRFRFSYESPAKLLHQKLEGYFKATPLEKGLTATGLALLNLVGIYLFLSSFLYSPIFQSVNTLIVTSLILGAFFTFAVIYFLHFQLSRDFATLFVNFLIGVAIISIAILVLGWNVLDILSPLSLDVLLGTPPFLGAAIAFGLVYYTFKKVEEGDRTSYYIERPVGCEKCGTELKEFSETELVQSLTSIQKLSKSLGNAEYRAWYCPQCRPHLSGRGFYLISNIINAQHTCPNCKELTLSTKYKVLKQATLSKEGSSEKTIECHNCNYHQKMKEVVPRKSTSIGRTSSSSTQWGSSYGSSYGGSSSSWGGGSSGGSDFGGGSSGGGGAGGDW